MRTRSHGKSMTNSSSCASPQKSMAPENLLNLAVSVSDHLDSTLDLPTVVSNTRIASKTGEDGPTSSADCTTMEAVSELRSLILTLCCRISSLEKTVEEQKLIIKESFSKTGVAMTTKATQTDSSHRAQPSAVPTYAEVVSSRPSSSVAQCSISASSNSNNRRSEKATKSQGLRYQSDSKNQSSDAQ
eukprot:TRINITY_DN20892_c1_g1_i1.p3 TRINITY_DN20892_c1_g1~~TRINITY_DN20892_c1_g1_i1.p3  ORF type:complete len:187 (-),score=12.82 TRINITY_DN20892_c1_g1_i1:2735-3295(-)